MSHRLLCIVVVVACSAGCASGADRASPAAATPGDISEALPPNATNASVVFVIDGDTIIADIDGNEENVRLIGIDTPEKEGGFRDPECFGNEATNFARELLPVGTPIRLTRDVEARDRFDRLLAYVFRADDDLFINLVMAEQGYAAALTIPPNVAYTDLFTNAARVAREADIGLWSACGDADQPID